MERMPTCDRNIASGEIELSKGVTMERSKTHIIDGYDAKGNQLIPVKGTSLEP